MPCAIRNPRRQRGVALVIVVIALLAVLAMAGLALDASHMGYNKARLQSAVDAAALSAAKVLDETDNAPDAAAAARATFDANAAAFPELLRAVGQGLGLTVQFSSAAIPFNAGTTPSRFVRVIVTDFTTDASLTRVLGVMRLPVRASAVAGPSPAVVYACNVVPMAVCGDAKAAAPYFGYTPGRVQTLRATSNSTAGTGTGNFLLLSFTGPGANDLRQTLAGGYDGCVTRNDTVAVKPGQSTGPTTQGINTRFNQYSGGGVDAARYPPDVVIKAPSPALTFDSKTSLIKQGGKTITFSNQLDVNFASYESDIVAKRYDLPPRPSGNGVFRRRELALPIVNCTGADSGRTSLPVLGLGCFFMLQPATSGSSEARVFGEFISDCDAGGRPGSTPPGTTVGPHLIQLYRDLASVDS